MRWHFTSLLFAWLLALVAAAPGLGHFVFIVPAGKGTEVQVIFSDTLAPDENVSIDKIAATNLVALDKAGKPTPTTFQKDEHALRVKVPAGTTVVEGLTDYGVAKSKHTMNIPVLLKYHSRMILGNSASLPASKAVRPPIEIVPQVEGGKLRLAALHNGKPAVKASCVVMLPGATKGERGFTDGQGFLPGEFTKSGQYGAWVRVVDTTPGEHNGKSYDKIHSYATLVVNFVP